MVFGSSASAMIPTEKMLPTMNESSFSSEFDMTIEGHQEKEIYGDNGESIGTLTIDPIEIDQNDVIKTYQIKLSGHTEVIKDMTWDVQFYNDSKPIPGFTILSYVGIVAKPSTLVYPGFFAPKEEAYVDMLIQSENPGKHAMNVHLNQRIHAEDSQDAYEATINVKGASSLLTFDFNLVKIH